MKVKYKGGPMHGKSQEFPDNGYYGQIRVAKPVSRRWDIPIGPNKDWSIHGLYQQSLVKQKNGAKIYVWLGWEDGTF